MMDFVADSAAAFARMIVTAGAMKVDEAVNKARDATVDENAKAVKERHTEGDNSEEAPGEEDSRQEISGRKRASSKRQLPRGLPTRRRLQEAAIRPVTFLPLRNVQRGPRTTPRRRRGRKSSSFDQILAPYRSPDISRSIFELAITAAPFVILWALMWASLGVGYWLCLFWLCRPPAFSCACS